MIKTLLLSFNLLLYHVVTGQDKPVLLEGKIDKYPIVMELSLDDTSCSVRYFYVNKKKDIHLEGFIDKKGNLQVVTLDRGDPKIVKESFDLRRTTAGYTGTWNSGKTKLPVSLNSTSPHKYNSPFDHLAAVKELKTQYPFDYLRIKDFVFQKLTTPEGRSPDLDWYKEKYSGIVFPRLKGIYDAVARKKINARLLEKHLMESKNSLECLGESYGEYELSIGDIFLDKNIFSVNVTVSYFCGGAHPDFGSEGLNFNGQTGDLLTLDEVAWFGKGKPPPRESHDWYDYRDKVFAPKVVDLLKKLYPDQMKKPGEASEDECDYTDPGVWEFPNWHFTRKGLYLGAVFGRVARVCDSPGWSVISYKELKPYLSPESKLRLPQ